VSILPANSLKYSKGPIMSNRITRAHLDAKAATLNNMTKSPADPSSMVNGKYRANVGNYHISGAYGGYCLHRMATEGGGVSDVFDCGHITAKQLAALMSAYMSGLYDATRGAA
jgi:hypothetical protein